MKIGKGSPTHMIDLVFTLGLFCVFAASALMVVLIGARVYQNTTERMNANFDGRASLAYVTNKIRQHDRPGAIRLQELEGGVMGLVLDQELEDGLYQTFIYHYDGALREVFTEEGLPFPLDSGQSILSVERFSVTESPGGLFRIESVDRQGNAVAATVASRCAGE